MFDSKILIVVVPLVMVAILTFFAYREISVLKENLLRIDTELKAQSTNASINIDQCVERIEKISKAHITELQNINKINSQKINKINHIHMETEETEGLSRNYISPDDNEEHDRNLLYV